MMKIAIKAAKTAGRIIKWNYRKQRIAYYYKQDCSITTKTDTEAEKAIVKILKKAFPDHQIFGEETGYYGKSKNDKYLWVIDPLDGTTNFAKKLNEPICVSIALTYQKRSILGVVYNPLTDELLTAERGKGAFLNGKPIKVNNIGSLMKSVIYVNSIKRNFDLISKFYKKVRRIRSFTSAVFQLCYIATGKSEGAIYESPKFENFAAAGLIIEEAGGKVTDYNKPNQPWSIDSRRLIFSNQKLHKRLVDMLH